MPRKKSEDTAKQGAEADASLRAGAASAEPAAKQPKPRGKKASAKTELPPRRREDDESPESRAGDGHADEHDGESDSDSDDDFVETEGEVVVDEGDEDPIPESKQPASLAPASMEGAALSRTDPLQAYLREVQRYKLLTAEEEQTLTRKYAESQDVQTAARLVTANLRLVVKLAYEYRRAYKNIMDLIQEGNIGLMQAVKRYDPYRSVKLSSYAAYWIRAYILRFILNNWRLVKLGTTQAQRKLFFNLNKEKARLTAMGIEPTSLEIAKSLNVDEKEVIDMDRRLSSAEASLDAPVGDNDGRSVSRLEMLPSGGSGPEAAFAEQEVSTLLRARLDEFRATLAGKDVIIFDKRMNAEDPLTLQELGDEFGISRERVRQLEARLTGKLRVYLKETLGDAVLPDS